MDKLDLTFVDKVAEQIGTGQEKVLEIAQSIQKHFGYLPKEALERVCELTDITPSSIVGVTTFYDQFRQRPAGKHIIKICIGTACHVKGSDQISQALAEEFGIGTGETTPDGLFSLTMARCLGTCGLAPVVVFDGEVSGRATPEAVVKRALAIVTLAKERALLEAEAV